MKATLALALVLGTASAIAAGCSQATAPAALAPAAVPVVAQAVVTAAGDVTLTVKPRVDDGRHLQAVVSGYSATSIDHLDLELKDLSTSTSATKTVSHADVVGNVTQTFAHLHLNTNYRLSGKAYLTTGSGSPISVDDASSAAITVGSNDQVASVTLPVKLVDQTFDGTATGAFNIIPSSATNAATPAAIL